MAWCRGPAVSMTSRAAGHGEVPSPEEGPGRFVPLGRKSDGAASLIVDGMYHKAVVAPLVHPLGPLGSLAKGERVGVSSGRVHPQIMGGTLTQPLWQTHRTFAGDLIGQGLRHGGQMGAPPPQGLCFNI